MATILEGTWEEIEARADELRGKRLQVRVLAQVPSSFDSLADLDPLTQLANRNGLGKEAEELLRHEQRFSLLYFDLDKFKMVNETLGHYAGDELLKAVGERVSSFLHAPDFAARLGGDEFVLLLHNTRPAYVESIVKRLLEHMEQPFPVQGQTIVASLSLGVACYPDDGGTL